MAKPWLQGPIAPGAALRGHNAAKGRHVPPGMVHGCVKRPARMACRMSVSETAASRPSPPRDAGLAGGRPQAAGTAAAFTGSGRFASGGGASLGRGCGSTTGVATEGGSAPLGLTTVASIMGGVSRS